MPCEKGPIGDAPYIRLKHGVWTDNRGSDIVHHKAHKVVRDTAAKAPCTTVHQCVAVYCASCICSGTLPCECGYLQYCGHLHRLTYKQTPEIWTPRYSIKQTLGLAPCNGITVYTNSPLKRTVWHQHCRFTC